MNPSLLKDDIAVFGFVMERFKAFVMCKKQEKTVDHKIDSKSFCLFGIHPDSNLFFSFYLKLKLGFTLFLPLVEKQTEELVFDEKIDHRLENLDMMLTHQYKEMTSMEDFIEEILDRRKEKLENGESLTKPSVTSESDIRESSRSRPRERPKAVKSKPKGQQQNHKPVRITKSNPKP